MTDHPDSLAAVVADLLDEDEFTDAWPRAAQALRAALSTHDQRPPRRIQGYGGSRVDCYHWYGDEGEPCGDACRLLDPPPGEDPWGVSDTPEPKLPSNWCDTCESEGEVIDDRCTLDMVSLRCKMPCPDCSGGVDWPVCEHPVISISEPPVSAYCAEGAWGDCTDPSCPHPGKPATPEGGQPTDDELLAVADDHRARRTTATRDGDVFQCTCGARFDASNKLSGHLAQIADLASALRRIARLEQALAKARDHCPHVVTSGGTSFCDLAEARSHGEVLAQTETQPWPYGGGSFVNLDTPPSTDVLVVRADREATHGE